MSIFIICFIYYVFIIRYFKVSNCHNDKLNFALSVFGEITTFKTLVSIYQLILCPYSWNVMYNNIYLAVKFHLMVMTHIMLCNVMQQTALYDTLLLLLYVCVVFYHYNVASCES